LIHGAGSFGHIMALKNGLEKPGFTKGREDAVSKVMCDVLRLDSIVIDELNKKGVKAVAVPPHTIYHGSRPDYTIIETLLRNGFVPTLYGDIIISNGKYRIISGDEIALDIARRFKPDSVVFATDVDGLYDSDPKTNDNAKFIPSIEARDISLVDIRKDATGSMAGKIERIKKIVNYTTRVVILNGNKPKRLENFLQGKETISTVIT
ncbi:MAG: isopentenyl phosphate kinase, partial [Thermoplasmatales archaeon]